MFAAACGATGQVPRPPDTDHGGATIQARGLGSQRNTRPVWSPDGSMLAFETSRKADGFNREIYVMNADGTNQHNCTQSPGRDFRPAWSRDASTIAFYSDRSGTNQVYQIAVAGGACSGQTVRLTDTSSAEVTGTSQAWGPGGRLAFTSKRDGNLEVYLMDAGGLNARNCTRDPSSDHDAAWSPDGTRLAFHSHRALRPKKGNGEIWIAALTADGACGPAQRVTVNTDLDENPSWSSDGRKLALHRNIPQPDGSVNYEVFVVDLETSAETRLTDTPANDLHPAWSPQGDRIAFVSNRSGRYEIWLMTPDGSGLRQLTGP